MKRITLTPQNKAVLSHLRKYGTLTPMSAHINYGIARLAARVDELHKLGFNIKCTIKTVNKKRYASYAFGV